MSLKVTTTTLDAVHRASGDSRAFVASLVDRFGTGRLMWGSNWSATRDRPYEEIAELGRHAFSDLSSVEQAQCLDENACRFWRNSWDGPAA